VAHDVVLQEFRLIGREGKLDISSHAGVDAVDPLAAGEQFFESRAAYGNERA